MAGTTKSGEASTKAPETTHDLELSEGDLYLLHSAVEIGKLQALEQAEKARQEQVNPSLFNPQPELWAAREAEALAVVDGYKALALRFGGLLGIEPGPVMVIVKAGSTVEGPAENNRPPSANPGAQAAR